MSLSQRDSALSEQAQSPLPLDVLNVIFNFLTLTQDEVGLLEKRSALREIKREAALDEDEKKQLAETEKSLQACSAFGTTCQFFRRATRHDHLSDTLMQHIENGNLIQVKKLFSELKTTTFFLAHPDLLQAFVIELLSRKRKCATYPTRLLTPLQLAFAEGNVDVCQFIKDLGGDKLVAVQLDSAFCSTIGQVKIPENLFVPLLEAICNELGVMDAHVIARAEKEFNNQLKNLIHDQQDLIRIFSDALKIMRSLKKVGPVLILAGNERTPNALFCRIVMSAIEHVSRGWLRKAFGQGVLNIADSGEPVQGGFTLWARNLQNGEMAAPINRSISPFLDNNDEEFAWDHISPFGEHTQAASYWIECSYDVLTFFCNDRLTALRNLLSEATVGPQ